MNGIVFAVIVLAASVVLVAVLAWVSRRLLGLPVGTLRAVIAGLVGFAAALIVGQALRAAESGHLAVFFSVAIGVPLIVAMIFIVAAEALVPTGAGPQPVELVLRARRSFARSRRYAQISRILVRHGLSPYLQGRPLRGWETAEGRTAIAVSLRRALEEGGVTFVKFGQLLSTRRDLLPEEFTDELSRLQDRAKPAPWEQGVPLIVAMIFIVAAEALVPTGAGPQPVEVVLRARRSIARSRRYAQISRILVRHGLSPYLQGRPLRGWETTEGRAAIAVSLRRALEEGGVTFVKFGQLLSTRRDLLPEEFTDELSRLQDRAEPAPWEQVEELISQSLGAPAREVFAELQPEPAAAASIAQVHKAWLRCEAAPGAAVAVKVQRPGIRATVEQDLDILLRLAARLEAHARWARAVGAVGVARGFGAAIREELDFRVEARNMAAMAATWKGQQRVVGRRVPVVIPAVHEELCAEHVLVIEWLDGINLRAAGPLIQDKGLDRAALARALLRSMVYQITEGGVFHADPHPGNVLLLTDGRLALLDFGSVGRLDAQQRAALLNLLSAVGRGDPAALRDALLELVTRPDDIDEQLLERALGRFMARHLAGGAATAEMFTDLFRLASRFELSIPPEVATVLRALGTLEGTLSLLTPTIDIVGEARAYAADRIAAQMSPGAVQKTAIDELAALLPRPRSPPSCAPSGPWKAPSAC